MYIDIIIDKIDKLIDLKKFDCLIDLLSVFYEDIYVEKIYVYVYNWRVKRGWWWIMGKIVKYCEIF